MHLSIMPIYGLGEILTDTVNNVPIALPSSARACINPIVKCVVSFATFSLFLFSLLKIRKSKNVKWGCSTYVFHAFTPIVSQKSQNHRNAISLTVSYSPLFPLRTLSENYHQHTFNYGATTLDAAVTIVSKIGLTKK